MPRLYLRNIGAGPSFSIGWGARVNSLSAHFRGIQPLPMTELQLAKPHPLRLTTGVVDARTPWEDLWQRGALCGTWRSDAI